MYFLGSQAEWNITIEEYNNYYFLHANIFYASSGDSSSLNTNGGVETAQPDFTETAPAAPAEADISMYLPVVEEYLSKSETDENRCILVDANGDGILELFLVYSQLNGSGFPCAYGAIYTIRNGNAVPVLRETELCVLAGGPSATLGTMFSEGKSYVAAFGDVISTEETYGRNTSSWYLCTADASFSESTEIQWAMSFERYDWESGTYIGAEYTITRNGASITDAKYENWLTSASYQPLIGIGFSENNRQSCTLSEMAAQLRAG